MQAFDDEFGKFYRGHPYEEEEKKRINGVLLSLQDDESLKDKSNGRYNREIELRKAIKEILS